jgi:hypothetical protein
MNHLIILGMDQIWDPIGGSSEFTLSDVLIEWHPP